MKPAIHLLLAAVFSILTSYSAKSQQRPAEYTDYDRGYYFFYYKKWDSAFLALNRYISDGKDTLLKGKSYNLMGDMQWKIGDLYAAQQSLSDAIRTLDARNKKYQEQIGYTYNLLGNVSVDLKQYDEAIHYYNNALPIFKGSDYFFEVVNGKAIALQKKGNYDDAVSFYDSALAFKPADQKLVARIIDNRAKTKWLQHPAYPALPEFRAALKIRTDSQFIQGLNASYAHLADYYAAVSPDSALWYAQKMREAATANHSPADILEALDKMVRLTNAPVLKERWYEEYKQLNDSLQLARDTTRYRFAMIRYDVQKSKEENSALQQHILRQRQLVYGLICGSVIIIIALITWYAKRRKRIKQESENAIRNARLKTSQKVHDVVANGLYGIMNELEHRTTIDREPLISRIENLYEKSRNISYDDIIPASSTGYNEQVHELLHPFAQGQTKLIVVGNQPQFWHRVSALQKQELQLVLREIMVNMKKHSQAKNAVVQFKEENSEGFISYKDDGLGFPEGFQFGNGLKNTVSRIKSINGTINFGKSGKEGVYITIRFPLQNSKHD